MEPRGKWIASCLGLCLLVGVGCGGEEDAVLARNLATGQIQSFSSEGEIPPGYTKCGDPTCSIPNVPCGKLGPKVCLLNPGCRLKELWCTGTGTVTPGGGSTVTSEECEYACIPKLPLLCDEIVDGSKCLARPDCEWTQGPCPMVSPCAPGSSCPPVPPCPFSCKTKATPPPPPVGCKSNLDCAKPCPTSPCAPGATCPPDPPCSQDFCLFKAGCGKLGYGTCVAQPQACAMYYAPVCGCDNKTYGNECEAHAVGVSVAHFGACSTPPPPPLGCATNADCAVGEFCFFKAGCGKLGLGNCMNQPQACAMYYAPVCGCDNKTYGNECEAHAAGVSVASQGSCQPQPPPPPPTVCAALAQQYKAELKKAKTCYPMSMTPVLQCGFEVSTDIVCNICTTFVNSTAGLDLVKKQWTANGCDKNLQWPCPAMACQPPVGGKCVSSASGSSAGSCQDMF